MWDGYLNVAMYYPIEEGTQITLKKYGYKVWIPKKPRNSEISYFNLKKSEQYFRRTLLPDWWKEKSAEEKILRDEQWDDYLEGKVKYEDLYVDKDCEEFRRLEWERRLNGFWFFNNGIPVYITGPHYYYLTWTKWDHIINDGYPVFYMNQVERFYFRQLCEEDPECMGYVIIGPRGAGKSNEEVSCQIEKLTRPPRRSKAAIQSKNDEDAKKKLFQEKAVPTFNGLPEFFKPQYNHGTYPKSEFSFHRDKVKGAKVRKYRFDPEHELENYIYAVTAKEKTLDGGTYCDIINDEVGKCPPHIANVYKRVKVNRQAVYRNNTKIGILRCCTTVEEMEEGGKECKDLWENSNPSVRTPNGRTFSWLYRYPVFIQEVDKKYADKFGNIDEESASKEHAAEIQARLGDYEEYSDYVRKNPMNEGHFFVDKAGTTSFNTMIIDGYRNKVDQAPKMYVTGNFKWEDERKPWKSNVIFERDDLGGNWELAMTLEDEGLPFLHHQKTKLANNFYYDTDYTKNREIIIPCNNHLFNFGIDPIKEVKTDDPRSSKMSAHIFFKYNDNIDRGKPIDQWESHRVIGRYSKRHDDPDDNYTEIAMAMLYFGCWANIETDVSNFKTFLRGKGMDKFHMTGLDFDVDSGFDSKKNIDEGLHSGSPDVKNAWIGRIKTFYTSHFHRLNACPFPGTLQQMREFDSKKSTKYDDVVSLGFTLLGAEAVVQDNLGNEGENNEPQNWFDQVDISNDAPALIEEGYDYEIYPQ